MIEGKTKIVTDNNDGTVTIYSKDVLTAGDGAKKENVCVGKYKTTQTVNVFNLLESKNVPTAFIKKSDDNSILCHKCDMLPLEFVARRYAFGSYLKRKSNIESGRRFDIPLQDIFHKYSIVKDPDEICMMPESEAREKFFINGEWKFVDVYTDPLIINGPNKWLLYPNNQELDYENCLMTINPVIHHRELMACRDILSGCFSVLENTWRRVETKHGPVSLVDMKIEIGRNPDGKLVIADVIDNDSWRIWPGGDPKNQLDKQCFRDGDTLGSISEKYELVAKLTEQF